MYRTLRVETFFNTLAKKGAWSDLFLYPNRPNFDGNFGNFGNFPLKSITYTGTQSKQNGNFGNFALKSMT